MFHLQYTFYELAWLFLVYSLLGWCAGVAATAVKRKKFVNTGVMNLPFCPIYGISAVAYSILLAELKYQPVFLFIGGMLISSFWVFVTGVVLERIFQRKWSDYDRFSIGFKGYITVPLLVLFGVAAILVLWVGNPLILKVISWIPGSLGRIIAIAMLVILAVDLLGTLAIIWKWKRYVERMARVTDNMQKVSATFGNAITRAVRKRLERTYPNLETEKMVQEKAAKEAEGETQKEAKFAEGCGFYKLAWLFLIGGVLGDLVETVFCRYTMGWWMSRSSTVYGAFSIVWGAACALLTAFLYRYRDRSDGFIFIYGTVVGGAYEYFCSVISEVVFGTIFWDYSKLPFNLGGRINLLYCFFWGIVAVLWVKWVYPFLSRLIEKIPKKIGPALSWALIVAITVNLLISAVALARYSNRQSGVEAVTELDMFLDERFPDERMEKVYPKAKVVR